MSCELFELEMNRNQLRVQRQLKVKSAIGGMLIDLLKDIEKLENNGHYGKISTYQFQNNQEKYSNSVCDIFETYFVVINDVMEFYEWMGINTQIFDYPPYEYIATFQQFMVRYRSDGDGGRIVIKLLKDVRNRFPEARANSGDDYVCI